MITENALGEILRVMLEGTPAPLCVSTASSPASHYIKANPAYLDLIGRSWDELNQKSLTADGGAIDGQARDRRLFLLESAGRYSLEPAEVRHSSGKIVPTLIPAQRRFIAGESVDIEIFLDLADREKLASTLRSDLGSAWRRR